VTWFWGLLAAGALLWPDRVSGPFDGVPLDQVAEAILLGVVFPALWWFQPRFLRTRTARTTIVILIVWKVTASALLVPEGWCVRFAPARPYVKNGIGAPHSWDMRADWRAPDPACTAVMRRPYERFEDFPAWFFNLPPADDNALDKQDRPPDATVAMTVQGFVDVPENGLLHIDTTEGVTAQVRADGGPQSGEVFLTRGVHAINVYSTLTGDRWRFEPKFNGRNLFAAGPLTLKRPARVDLLARPWARWIPASLTMALLGCWLIFALMRAGDPVLLAWMAVTSTTIGLLIAAGRVEDARWALAALGAAALLPLRPRVRNVFGAFVAIGIPWLTFVIVSTRPAIGQLTMYSWGNDWWSFQRYAYRIVLQGYWLEGGSPTFWFQPLYRWIAGLLHVVFGDSSVGEGYWDAACVLTGALFAFRVVRQYAGFRWGLIGAVVTLGLFVLSNERVFLGLGLGEISSMGLLHLAAFFVMRSRHGRLRSAAAGGVLATLGFYTRLNNLPMAIGTAVFALPGVLATQWWYRPVHWWRRVSWRAVVVLMATIGIGITLFAWRTWYYTGVFSMLYGTSRDQLAIWQPGMRPGAVLERAVGSVMMVLTLNDPARYDPFAIPVIGGAVAAILGLLGVPRLRTLPMGLSLFFLSAVAGAFVARGSAYAGRFSLHIIPVTCALSVSAIAGVISHVRRHTSPDRQEHPPSD
jgi:hypothetical protein